MSNRYTEKLLDLLEFDGEILGSQYFHTLIEETVPYIVIPRICREDTNPIEDFGHSEDWRDNWELFTCWFLWVDDETADELIVEIQKSNGDAS